MWHNLRCRTLGGRSGDTAEATPAVAVMLLDMHVLQARTFEPALEFIASDVKRDWRNQVIENYRALLTERERRDVSEVFAIGQPLAFERTVEQTRGRE